MPLPNAFTLPEFTRSLRGLAAPTASGPLGAEHDLAWAPFRQALTAAHRTTAVESQVAAFEPGRIERGLRTAIRTMAEARFPKSPADGRALEAELDVAAEPFWRALARVGEAAKAVRLAKQDALADAWATWVESLRAMFRAADDWWLDAESALSAHPGTRSSPHSGVGR